MYDDSSISKFEFCVNVSIEKSYLFIIGGSSLFSAYIICIILIRVINQSDENYVVLITWSSQ